MKNSFLIIALLFLSSVSFAQNNAADEKDSIMVTVVMRHLQENPVDSIQNKIMKQGFYNKITKAHAKILSWNVVMGIGQIITLKLEPKYLRELNLVFESGAWGGFKTEFYPTYDFLPVYPAMLEKENTIR